MFLKRLELIGFKSFANRTELEFGPGITVVVGPNGSGKSNISDSIRWVLGEQSAKSLRGSKMEDVIFAGSDARKPVNYCEVSLTMDNYDQTLKLDYHEITVTRRVYRSGESEYYINKQACRLRDITELFMDTGVGKEAYSIIGQGRIEEILSTKSEERRGIFEEAAGIVKYKTRKKESEKKLHETEANLVRIQDIISEISNGIDTLKQQADLAKHYMELKDELKQQEVSFSIYQIEHLHQCWQQANDSASTYREQLTVKASELSSLDAQLSEWKWKVNEQDGQLEELQTAYLQVSEEVEKTEGRREVLRERKKNAEQNQQAAQEKLRQLQGKREQIQKEQTEQEQDLGRLLSQYQTCQEELNQNEAQLLKVTLGLQADVDQLKGDYIELLNGIASAKNDIRHHEQTKQMLVTRQARLKEQQLELQGQVEKLEKKNDVLQQELLERSKLLEDTVTSYKQLIIEQRNIQNSKEDYVKRLRDIEQRIQSLTSRRDVLQEMQSDFSGFIQGVKEVLKAAKKGLEGIHGAIAELLSVPVSYETAIEVALGGALQHVVVENESAGRKAIAWLKDHRLGRATFLPIDVIRSRRISSQDESKLQGIEGFVGIASDLVESDRRYRNICENLLGSVIIMKNLEAANAAARQFAYRYRFVTLEGDVVNPGGAMTGGTIQQKNTNLLGRARQMEECNHEIHRKKEEKDTLASQLSLIDRSLSEMASSLDELRQKGEEYRLQEQQVKSHLTQIEQEKKNMTGQLHRLQQEWTVLSEDVGLNEQKIKDKEQQVKEWSQEEKALSDKISFAENHRSSLEQAKETYTAQITELKVKAAEYRKLQESVQTTLGRMKAEYADIQQEWDQTFSYHTELVRMTEGNQAEKAEVEEQIVGLRSEREMLGHKISQLKQERVRNIEGIDEVDSQAKVVRKHIKDLEKKLHQEEVKVGRLDVELDAQLDHLLEAWGLSYELAKETFQPPSDPEETSGRVQELKRNIEELGVINLGAIEEYDRQFERQQFLMNQSKDLEEAKQTLYGVIQEIEEEMGKRFSETFESIRVEFQQIFTHLFVGGRADLILSDPDHILATGIDIVAQPPGKKLQNLALLSGGEKALTAIALLFAILRVKPVPFCVLDEVEAALDDANVYRFAEFLREFSGQTQFICVSHRKGTMEGADVLYGVTMQEFGVSKLVSVKLEDQQFIPA